MSSSNNPPNNQIFSDSFDVNDIDQGGKKFDRVSRLKASSDNTDMEVILDFNSEIYPLKIADKFQLTLTSISGKRESWRDDKQVENEMAGYDYVMFGKVYKYDEREKGKASVYVSFGGLLLCLSGEPLAVNIGQELYVMLRKVREV
ncbi:hypothetical protein HDU76_004327 [Blyttiomyces sp. JEL0837]|nr:hypothetical protein HDU76_004327 [Blyttiomyces sp. JEL0837]